MDGTHSGAAGGGGVHGTEAGAAFFVRLMRPSHDALPLSVERRGDGKSEGASTPTGNEQGFVVSPSPVVSNIDVDEGGDASPLLSVSVPVAFTSVAGRDICIRETRSITRNSPYWRLLFECPLTEGCTFSTDVHDNEVMEDNNCPQRVRQSSQPRWRRRSRESNTYLFPVLDDTFVADSVRCRSCPSGRDDDALWEYVPAIDHSLHCLSPHRAGRSTSGS
uniref:WGS project CAEQ00000000 data, annotated contig 555 n=1 Tax=Trypanosoma congolense (strain IL3000) TaxID=1068625 RepID=F9WGV3_TRYCI|nr:unnamed protein product [Trypanosoma congolense IL3000]